MATQKEKQLAVLLLKERLERLSGKKVVITEDEVSVYSGYTSTVKTLGKKK